MYEINIPRSFDGNLNDLSGKITISAPVYGEYFTYISCVGGWVTKVDPNDYPEKASLNILETLLAISVNDLSFFVFPIGYSTKEIVNSFPEDRCFFEYMCSTDFFLKKLVPAYLKVYMGSFFKQKNIESNGKIGYVIESVLVNLDE